MTGPSDTTVKNELIALNAEMERLTANAIESGVTAEEIVHELTQIRRELAAQADFRASAIREAGLVISAGLANLGTSIERTGEELGTSLIASAVLMSRAQQEQSDEVVWVKKVIRCLAVVRSRMESRHPITAAELEEQMLFTGMSPHDAKYVVLACLDKGYFRKTGSENELIEIDDNCPNFRRLVEALQG